MRLIAKSICVQNCTLHEVYVETEIFGRWLFAIGKHIAQFRQDMYATHVWATRRASQEIDLLLRIRQLGQISREKATAFAQDVGIAPQEALSFYKGLATTGLLTIDIQADEIIKVIEHIFTENMIYRAIAKRFEDHHPNAAERALIPMLDLFSSLPLKEEEAIDRLVKEGYQEEDLRRTLELQHAFRLVRSLNLPDFGGTLLYNEYLWGHKIEKVAPIIDRLSGRDYEYLRALIQEIKSTQGQGIDRLTSAPEHLIKMAANVGIIDTVTIETNSGREQTFTFAPLFYGYQTGPADVSLLDTSDQVKLFVASIQYGTQYSEDFKLHSPILFLDSLLRKGVAGNATPIRRDYTLVERQGILAVEKTTGDRGRFVLKKKDVVQMAKEVLETGGLFTGVNKQPDTRFLVTQKSFRSPEENRLRSSYLAAAPDRAETLENDIISAIRQNVTRGNW